MAEATSSCRLRLGRMVGHVLDPSLARTVPSVPLRSDCGDPPLGRTTRGPAELRSQRGRCQARDEESSVTEVATSPAGSRSWIYELIARYRPEVDAAFVPRSRRPKPAGP
jgi:hypothetical protein